MFKRKPFILILLLIISISMPNYNFVFGQENPKSGKLEITGGILGTDYTYDNIKTNNKVALNLKAKFSGNSIFDSSEAVKSIVVNKTNFDTPSGYDDNDYQKLVKFLESPSANSSGTKNGQELNPDYSPTNPDTWTGITWTEDLDIKKVEKIDISSINSISGNLDLSGLSNLQELSCYDTGISSLDLTGLSNLLTLECSNTGISSLDLIGLSNLQSLNCSNTQISSLNLKGISNLQVLDCSNTSISNLDVIGLYNLQELWCDNTSISSLDLTELSNLQTLSCGYTEEISSLDLTGLSNLQYLDCGYTGISSLDLTDVSNLQVLDCSNTGISNLDLTRLSNLRYLACNDTDIRSLDLTGLSNLQTLYFNDTDIRSLDLTGLSNLQSLSCNYTAISSLELSGLSSLQSLSCYNTEISSLDLSGLSELEFLECTDCKLGINELKKLKLDYTDLFNDSFLNQHILGSYLFIKGDIKEFGSETSTYKWYIDDELIDLKTSAYDFSEYSGRQVRCEITDGDITLNSNIAIITDTIFETPSGYDDNDYQKLVKFLESPNANSSGTKNGQELNPDYSPTEPDTWTGITWTEGSDIKKVEKIDISSKNNISGDLDLTGFSNLRYLYCGYTNISNLDLSGLSNLEVLYCGETNISSLDLTGLSNLQDLYCGDTDISSLDLSGLSNLKKLHCLRTDISNLDLSGVPNLDLLSCGETNITSLDLTGLSNLEFVYCGNTGISSLDLSELSNLQTLDCSYTEISSLDLSGLSNLQTLSCGTTGISNLDLTGLSNLQTLSCGRTDISNLDLTGLSNLQTLDCSNTSISSLDVTGLSNLKELRCLGTDIRSLDLTGLSSLEILSCRDTNINSLTLTGLSNLQELYCSYTDISSLDLTGFSNLKKLDFFTSSISSLTLTGLSNLQELECSYTDISSLDLTGLSNLRYLACNYTEISSLDLSGLSNLRYLSCNYTDIRSLDLTGLSKLATLNCSNCKLGITELKKLKLVYPNLFKNSLLNQDILDSYLFAKGDIKEFGSETSTYTWYIGSKLMDLKTSAYDFSAYNDSQVRCEITDGNITLVSNTATIKDTVDVKVKFQNPPQSISKGSQVKLSVKLEPDINIDKSVSWEVYDSTASTISQDGILNVPLEEASKVITVRATSNFDNTKYAEINLNILSPSQIDLQTDKDRYTYGDTIKLTAIISKNQNARANNSNKIAFYNGDNLLETKQLVDNSATIEIDTKTTGAGTLNLKAKFSGNDVLGNSEAVKRIVVNKANFDTPSGYDDNDYQKLVKFLESPSANSSGTKNGQELNLDYSPTDPDTWTGITWTKDLDIKKVERIMIVYKNISGNWDLTGFSNLKSLYCYNTKINSLDLNGLSSLEILSCHDTKISSLDLTGLSNLQKLSCSSTNISSLDLIGLSNLQELKCASTGISSLDVTGLSNLQTLYCESADISSLTLTGLSNLKSLYCSRTKISSLDLTGLSNLQKLECSNTNISSLDLTGLSNLQTLKCDNTDISSLDLTGLSNLQELGCSHTKISSLDLTGLSNLQNLACINSSISNLTLTGLSSLESLSCYNTDIRSLDLTGLSNLQTLYCSETSISNLDLTGLSNLQNLYCASTSISNLDLTGLSNLQTLNCSNTADIRSLDLTGLSNLQSLTCTNSGINSLTLTGLSSLESLSCSNTGISNLDLTGLSNLQNLDCYNTDISSLDLTGLSKLETLNCSKCKLGITELKKLKLDYPNLFKNSFLKQDIFGSYLFVKGDIKEFGSETSTYKWYISSDVIELPTSAYDFSAYNNRQVRCEITDGDITLVSNKATIKDTVDVKVKFYNPPQGIAKGSQVKLLVKLEPDINIDKSVSWEVYNSTASTISQDGILNVPLEEASKVITVRATSNFDNTKYAEINLNILSPSQIDLQTDKERYIYGDTIKLTATVSENQNARANNSNKIAFYNGDNLLETKQVVDNKATIAIDTKPIGVGAFNLKVKFSGNDNFESSEAVKRIDIDKAKFNIPVNLKWHDKIAVWDTVYECLEYQIKLYKDNEEIANVNSNTNNYEFTKYFTSTGNYKFQVKALGNQNYNESAWSAEVKIYIYLDLEYNIDKCLELLNDPEATAKDLIEAIVGLSKAITEFELNTK